MYAIGIGVIVLVGAMVAFLMFLQHSSAISAYQSASSCASPSDAMSGQACRFKGQTQVLSTSRHDRLEAVVSFDALSDRTFHTSFPNDNEPSSTALRGGATADGELWAGRVTRLAGKPTVDNPEPYPAQSFLVFATFFAVSGLVILFMSSRLAKAAWRRK
ncbi:MAG: hypothetical protein ACYDAL_16750 [Candidatus Dormibacteraceae bacterium]